jgi:uncharacterized protein HemX
VQLARSRDLRRTPSVWHRGNVDEQHRTSETRGIAHEIVEEVTKAVQNPTRARWWNMPLLAAALTSVLAAAAIVGGLGRAFFVERASYQAAEQTNALEHERMRQTLERIDRSLTNQTAILEELRRTVQAQEVDLAVVGGKKHR